MTVFKLMSFPFRAGFKDRDTSMQAAKEVEPKAAVIREKVYLALYHHFTEGATSHQLAEYLNEQYNNVQPRTSELYVQGKIKPSNKYGKTPSGKRCKVWVVA